MGKLLYRVLIFLLPILLLIIGLELIVRNNPKKAKATYIQNQKDSIEVLLLGPSTMALAINPEYLNPTTAPLAITGNTIPVDYALFKHHLDKFPKLKLVIMDLSNGYLEYMDPGFSPSGSLLVHYDLIKGRSTYELKNIFVTTANFKYALHKANNILFKNDVEEYNQWGFLTELNETAYSFKDLDYDKDKIQNSKAVNDIFRVHAITNDQAYDMNTTILKDIIDICKSRNIKLIFLSTPKYVYYQNVENNYNERRYKFLKEVVDSRDVFFFDHENHNNEDPQKFYDILHLNKFGAQQYTNLVNDSIIRPILLAD